jgi:hypothetical protein
MGRSLSEAGSGRDRRSAWRRGLLGVLLPLGLLAWQVDPGTLEPAAPPAPPAPVATPEPAPEAVPDLSFLPPPPEALAPRVPQHVPRVSLELPRRHRRSFLTQALVAAAAMEEQAAADAALALPVADEIWPLGLPDNPLTDLRPLYFIDGPGGGAFPLRRRHRPPVPVPEPATALLVLLGLATSGLAAPRTRRAGSPPRDRRHPAPR